MLSEYPDVLKKGIGEIKRLKARLYVKENCQPKFFKPKLVPYAIQSRVENEIKRLVSMEILEPIKKSNWATLIVPAIKPDGSVRICGDIIVTLNPV
ncbi:hypothetical protein AVEN_132323-1 [Araneus ventricosus]|uniref:Reverse transcriptase domain-containing protein n=1 Tax=Araneus ventricosus TaxID=182803 RepID=A0A4Y2NJ38_ARAVE|nr:hypothetical protein AVEN_132323-1 [Araneus ventricosus]